MELDKKEYYIIGAFLALLIPLIVFVIFWWSIASFDIFNILAIPENIIAVVAVTGLAIGIVLDIIYLKKWTTKFYEMNKVFSILLYLFCSFMAVAFFMGFPIGNLLLGFLAGVYVGRKWNYLNNSDRASFSSASKKVGIFSASVTSIEAFPIGVLALQEESIIDSINRVFGLVLFNKNIIQDIVFILTLCIIIFWIQYSITMLGTKISFRKNHR